MRYVLTLHTIIEAFANVHQSTAFLLARLEQANQVLASDQKFGGPKRQKSRKQSRPPSITVLKRLVNDPSAASNRYSALPEPPPLTELEFWAALVKDYEQTAQRLPTLTANKIKGGVPPPIRGLVWISMVGARDRDLSELFDKLVLEHSEYDTIIAKDVGRSFPLVEMFRDPNGPGQQMLGRVLKAFSLYDKDIGYCQGLGFLVGPLLMQMGDSDAFCVLVRLMDNFDLRSCFLPDLSGLHLRIFQFQRLLEQDMPELAAHLKKLQLEAAFLSQWFLSFFAVTCPLDMLFRIYDVIFAEGASETIMRVALALMKRNKERLLSSDEFEDCMKLLLQPALWDVWNHDADAMVNDFMGMTGLVTRDSLSKLDLAFKSEAAKKEAPKPLGFTDVTAAASSFIGRLWTNPASSLSPDTIPTAGGSRPTSSLRRTASKQSLASTTADFNSEGTGSIGTVTTATDISRNSSADVLSIRSKTESLTATRHAKDRDLHMQIEDLLAALSEMQRDAADLTTHLQKEREERSEDQRLLKDLSEHVKAGAPSVAREDRRRTLASPAALSPASQALSEKLRTIVERVDERLAARDDLRRSSMLETKQQLRESLARHRDQLAVESARSAELSRKLDSKEKETAAAREELRDARARIQADFLDRQKLERTIAEMRSRHSSANYSDGGYAPFSPISSECLNRRPTSSTSSSPVGSRTSVAGGGLREFKLGKRESRAGPTSYHPPRGSSLATKEILTTANHAPAADEAMLLELVNAKTAEAVARQEIDELKGRLDAMRRQMNMSPINNGTSRSASGSKQGSTSLTPTASAGSLVSSWAGSWGSGGATTRPATGDTLSPSPAQASAGAGESSIAVVDDDRLTPPVAGGFWSWGKRSLSSSNANGGTSPSG